MRSRKAILGDTQTVALLFPEAKAGETWYVDVIVTNPDGTKLANYLAYKFYKPIKRRLVPLRRKK